MLTLRFVVHLAWNAPASRPRAHGRPSPVASEWHDPLEYEGISSTPGHTSLPQPPINRVPIEILCRVFAAFFKSSSSMRSPSQLAHHHNNLTLFKITAVCKHWRYHWGQGVMY